MKRLYLCILLSIIAIGNSFCQDPLIFTPRGVSLSVDIYSENTDPEIAYADSIWRARIEAWDWDATIISHSTVTYNCHSYAWHVSDGGAPVVLTGSGNVAKYFSGDSATYAQTTEIDTLEKIVYYPVDHSAITSNDPNYVISKWGGGPLVRHHPEDCPFDVESLIYYKLDIAGDNSIAKGTATNATTLDIQGATYNWIGDSYVCATGEDIALVTGLETTPGYNTNGTLRVEMTSPFSNTTVKGNKRYTIGSTPYPLPSISGQPLVCSSGNDFTLCNVPPGNSVSWTCSSNLYTSEPTANPCTFVAIGNGSGWVKANLSTTCSNNIITVNQYSVWVGAPLLYSISGPEYGQVYNGYSFSADPVYQPYSDADYSWNLSPLYDNVIYPFDNYADIYFYSSGYYQVVAQATNSCGSTDWALTYIEIDAGRSYSISPNPASNQVTITVKQPEILSSNKMYEAEANYTVRIFNGFGRIQKQGKYSGDRFTIPLGELPDGNYIIQIENGKDISNHKLIIKQ